MITPEREVVNPELWDPPVERPAAALRVVHPGRTLEAFAFRACQNGIIRAVGHARIAGRVYRNLRLIVPHYDAPYLYSPVHRGLWDVPRSVRDDLLRAALSLQADTGGAG